MASTSPRAPPWGECVTGLLACLPAAGLLTSWRPSRATVTVTHCMQCTASSRLAECMRLSLTWWYRWPKLRARLPACPPPQAAVRRHRRPDRPAHRGGCGRGGCRPRGAAAAHPVPARHSRLCGVCQHEGGWRFNFGSMVWFGLEGAVATSMAAQHQRPAPLPPQHLPFFLQPSLQARVSSIEDLKQRTFFSSRSGSTGHMYIAFRYPSPATGPRSGKRPLHIFHRWGGLVWVGWGGCSMCCKGRSGVQGLGAGGWLATCPLLLPLLTTVLTAPPPLSALRRRRAGQGWPLPVTPLFVAAEELSGLSVADDSTSLVLPGAGREGIDDALQQLLRCVGGWADRLAGWPETFAGICPDCTHIPWQ